MIVMDITMPILNGFEAARRILKTLPTTKILILSAHSDDEYIDQMIEIGATGYLLKQSAAEVLSEAIRDVKAGKSFFSPNIEKRIEEKQEIAWSKD